MNQAKIVLIFTSRLMPTGPNEQVFIEAHDENGNSINVGEWAADGEYETLTLNSAAIDAKHLKALDDVTAISVSPGNADVNEYMRGMANGLILAQSIFKNEEPKYIEPPAVKTVDEAINENDQARASKVLFKHERMTLLEIHDHAHKYAIFFRDQDKWKGITFTDFELDAAYHTIVEGGPRNMENIEPFAAIAAVINGR